MRKYLLVLVMAMLCSICVAQNTNILNIPVSGDIATFQKSIAAKGFTLAKSTPTERIYNGKYDGKVCKMYVHVSPEYGNAVYEAQIIIRFRQEIPAYQYYEKLVERYFNKIYAANEYVFAKFDDGEICFYLTEDDDAVQLFRNLEFMRQHRDAPRYDWDTKKYE